MPSARAWLLVDGRDGARLAGHDASVRLPIASATKLMTAYLALRDLKPSARLAAPAYAPAPGESLLGLRPGERDSVHDLLYGLLLPSGNDAAVTLADGVAGSVPAFVAMMNRAAARLGLADTHYATPVGLDAPGNYSSARDLVRLVRVLRRDRRFDRIVGTRRATLRGGAVVRRVVNRNDLLFRAPWVNGVKTGYTSEAGNVLVASATRHGTTLVSVLLGAPTVAARDAGSLALLRYGFSLYHRTQALRRGRTAARVPLRHASARLPLSPASDVRVWARSDQRLRVKADVPSRLTGPVPRGRRLGTATVLVDGRPQGTVPLRAARPAPAPVVAKAVELPGHPSRGVAEALGALAVLAGLAILACLVTLRSRR